MDPIRFLGAASMGWKLIKHIAGREQRRNAKRAREEAEGWLNTVRSGLIKLQINTRRMKGDVGRTRKRLDNAEADVRRLREQLTPMESRLATAEEEQVRMQAEMEQAQTALAEARTLEAELAKKY